MLVQTAELNMKASMTNLRENVTEGKIHKDFDNMKRGEIRQAGRFVTQCLSGGSHEVNTKRWLTSIYTMMPDAIDANQAIRQTSFEITSSQTSSSKDT